MEKVKCPVCGSPTSLVGPSNQNYPAAFRCYNLSAHRGEYNFSATDPGVDRAAAARVESNAIAQSRANAETYRK